MDLLAIVAHPDDAAFTCGGTLAKHADAGHEVTVAYATRGAWGGTRDDRAEVREREARNCVEALGGEAVFLDGKDGRLEADLDARFDLVEVVRSATPDAVITWHHDDPHPDHRTVGQLARDAAFQAATMGLDTASPPCDRPDVFYVGKPSTSFEPDTYVDVTDLVDAKVDALYEHETEVERLETERGYGNVGELVRTRTAAYGQECGVPHAEGFVRDGNEVRDYLG